MAKRTMNCGEWREEAELVMCAFCVAQPNCNACPALKGDRCEVGRLACTTNTRCVDRSDTRTATVNLLTAIAFLVLLLVALSGCDPTATYQGDDEYNKVRYQLRSVVVYSESHLYGRKAAMADATADFVAAVAQEVRVSTEDAEDAFRVLRSIVWEDSSIVRGDKRYAGLYYPKSNEILLAWQDDCEWVWIYFHELSHHYQMMLEGDSDHKHVDGLWWDTVMNEAWDRWTGLHEHICKGGRSG